MKLSILDLRAHLHSVPPIRHLLDGVVLIGAFGTEPKLMGQALVVVLREGFESVVGVGGWVSRTLLKVLGLVGLYVAFAKSALADKTDTHLSMVHEVLKIHLQSLYLLI